MIPLFIARDALNGHVVVVTSWIGFLAAGSWQPSLSLVRRGEKCWAKICLDFKKMQTSSELD
jgi:hypothetical protein